MEKVEIAGITLGPDSPLAVFAGLCVLEDEAMAVSHASRLREICARQNMPFVFKASFDKANRTSMSSPRGPGLDAGLAILEAVKRETGVAVLTDIHEPGQAEPASRVVDVLQIPAFLCRQTDLLTAAGRTGKVVNIKKGQFMAPADMVYAAEKVRSAGGRPMLTERGTSFGHRDLVVDMRSLVWMRAAGTPLIFDGTHSVQQPGAQGGATGGLREMVAPLVRAATAVGIDGLYLEVHPDPDQSLSDGPNCLDPNMFARLLADVAAIRQALGG